MGSASVVVRLVLGEDQPQVSFAEDQHRVCDLRPGGAYEPFGMGVRPWAWGRNRHGLDTGTGQGRVERCGELPGPVAGQEPDVRGVIAEVQQEIADLLRGPRPVRVRGDPEDMDVAAANFDHEQAVQSTWKKSAASIVAACARRNCRQVVSVCRLGAGGIFSALRTRPIVDAPARWPTLNSSPWIRF